MADPFDKLSKPADPFAKLSATPAPQAADPFSKLSQPEDKIQQEIETRKWYDRPVLAPQQITDEELRGIATKYGTSTEDLRSALPLLGGIPQGVKVSDVLKGAAGFVGEAVTLGVPQKLYRMAQDPKQEAALDELRELVSGRKSYAQYAAEFAVPGVGTAKLAKAVGGGLKGAAAVGATVGAAGGFGASKAGEEVSGTVIGAGAGAVIGMAGEKLVQKLSSKAGRKLTEPEAKAISSLDLDTYEQQALKELQSPGNKAAEELVMGEKSFKQMKLQEIDEVLDANYSKRELELYTSKRDSNPNLNKIDPDLEQSIGFEFAAKKALVENLVNRERAGVIKEATGEDLVDPAAISNAWNKLMVQGREEVQNNLNRFRKENLTLKFANDAGMFDIHPETKLGQAAGYLSDARTHLNTIDEKFGTPTQMILSKLSRNQNIMGGIREVDKKAIEKLDDEITKFGLRRAAKDGRMVDLVEGTAKVASDAEQKAVEGINSYWENVYKFVTDGIKETGVTAVNIPKLDKYAARMTKEVPEVLTTLELELNKATREANNLLKKNYQDISQIPAEEFDKIRNSVPVQNLVEYLNWLTNSSVQIKDGSGLSIAVRQSMRSEDSIRVLDKVARSTIERTATDFGIPNFIREKDIYKIMDRYSQDMLSYLYQREPLAELRSYARMIRARDGLSEAKYIETIVEDTLGVRKGTTAHFMRDAKGQIARLLNPAIEKAKAEGNQTAEFVYSSIKEMADLPSFLANQIYPNLLGWNPKAVLTNVLGSISRAAPELGGTYGYTNLARGLVWARQNWSNASKELVQKGYVPGEWTRTAQKALADGIRASSLVNIPLKTLEKINALGMWFYSKSEQLNRIVLLGMSKTMAYDLSLGRAAAQRSLSKFPTSVRRAVSRAKNITEIEDILMGHMNSKIGLDYNRSSLSEFARTMGPMFSTFSKWPTTIAGETISEYRVKPMSAATRRSAERYAIPLLGFAAIDYMLADHLEESDTLQKIVGKGGLRSAAPVSAATAFVRGDIFTPPVVDTIMQDIIIPVSNAEGVKLGKGLDRTAFTYTPGAGLIKFLTDTIPTFVTGERPEGSTQTERSLKGSGVIY